MLSVPSSILDEFEFLEGKESPGHMIQVEIYNKKKSIKKSAISYQFPFSMRAMSANWFVKPFIKKGDAKYNTI